MMVIAKEGLRPAAALMLLCLATPAGAITYNCLPIELVELAGHVRVHCTPPSNFEGGYPLDGAARIEYFAVPTSDAAFSKRFVYIVQTALTAGMVVQFQYASGTLTPGCDANSCRRPSVIGLLAAGTDVRIPYTTWPGNAAASLGPGAWQHYGPFSISNFRRLAMKMTGTGNVDLYVRRDSPPTDAQFTCRPALGGSAENVTINGPSGPPGERAATYYVAVRGVGASNTFKLSVAIEPKPAGASAGGC